MIHSNSEIFNNKQVMDYEAGEPLKPAEYAYRLRTDYDGPSDLDELLDAIAADPAASSLEELIIGMFSDESSDSIAGTVEKLIELKDVFKNLKALFLGDIMYEECEISWINQTDLAPLLNAYPALEYFRVRGGEELAFTDLSHDTLTTLIVETGGMPPNVISEICAANLPKLQNLELWLGSDSYGFDSGIDDFAPILSGGLFPQLKRLGLMDSQIQDEIAIAVANAPVLQQIEYLDLSMGTLSDKGAEALLASEGVRKLKGLNLRHHYMSGEMMEKMEALSAYGVTVDVSEQEDDDDEDSRYVEVAE